MTQSMQRKTPAAQKKLKTTHRAGGDDDKPQPDETPEYEDTPPPKEKSRTATLSPADDTALLDVDQGDIQKAQYNLGRNGQKSHMQPESDAEEWQNEGRPALGQSDEIFEEEISHSYHDPDRAQHDWHTTGATHRVKRTKPRIKK